MDSKTALKIEDVSKKYRLGAISSGTLKGEIQAAWSRLRKRDGSKETVVDNGPKGIGKLNETFFALEDINLEVKRSEALGIIGHNGAGKSTLLKLLSRVTAPTSGRIFVNGRISSMLEVGTGFHPELTGRENVFLNGAILGMTKAEIAEKFDRIVEFSEMEKFIDTPVKRYSSGMHVKLGFAVAAHLDSDIMIIDEVLAVGDLKFRQKCMDKMNDAKNREEKTILYVSHNVHSIRQLCTRCIVMERGRIIFDGGTEEAIGIYSGGKEISGCFIDIENEERAPEFAGGLARMKTFSLKDRDVSSFRVGERMSGEIVFDAMEDRDNVLLRAVIWASDGTPVTMATTTAGVNVRANQNNSLKFDLDISKIVPGKYSLSFVLYHVNSFGVYFNLDGVKEAFKFEIEASKGFTHNIEWNPKYWGHTYSEGIRLLEG